MWTIDGPAVWGHTAAGGGGPGCSFPLFLWLQVLADIEQKEEHSVAAGDDDDDRDITPAGVAPAPVWMDRSDTYCRCVGRWHAGAVPFPSRFSDHVMSRTASRTLDAIGMHRSESGLRRETCWDRTHTFYDKSHGASYDISYDTFYITYLLLVY